MLASRWLKATYSVTRIRLRLAYPCFVSRLALHQGFLPILSPLPRHNLGCFVLSFEPNRLFRSFFGSQFYRGLSSTTNSDVSTNDESAGESSSSPELVYTAKNINTKRILKHTAFGALVFTWFTWMEYLLISAPEAFPFHPVLPHSGILLSLGFLAWRFKACRDTVFDMTRTSDNVLGIRGLTLLARPVNHVAEFHVNDLAYHAEGPSHDFFYVGVVQGEYFRMFRFEHGEEVERLFKVQPEQPPKPYGAGNLPSSRGAKPLSIAERKPVTKRRVVT